MDWWDIAEWVLLLSIGGLAGFVAAYGGLKVEYELKSFCYDLATLSMARDHDRETVAYLNRRKPKWMEENGYSDPFKEANDG